MVDYPGDYVWSSYRINAQGEPSGMVAKHDLYEQLGTADDTRQQAYRELFRHQLDPGMINEIRQATNGNYALGSPRFQAQVEAVIGQRVTRGKSGRPRKAVEPRTKSLLGRE